MVPVPKTYKYTSKYGTRICECNISISFQKNEIVFSYFDIQVGLHYQIMQSYCRNIKIEENYDFFPILKGFKERFKNLYVAFIRN